ncbi:16S rRNA (cytosine(1402)-N(4))-methyltransferase RsmH [Thermoflexibacter ruber]|uniref:Ribosomal RNA small subunit methyltransferase H n=1 Tax=Thermoflexibacter ruber TaxID=1003 RepID=A0A1I2HTM2_9BACT|nr:16S rRNA (cytosine(1402)-N(4))-methyltransferase RsmH [Thermoflexibacter ruber]SFF33404.1 16S rRNA (cytosine1402-N4)-methyltransferase [Thermoflexibacter ruber]
MYHIPVLLKESIEGLTIKPDGVYVDLTFGGGGHSKEILRHLDKGKLFAFDQDDDAEANARNKDNPFFDNPKFQFIKANFRYLKKYLKLYKISQVDGILADLGISSHQIDEASRGFSTRFDGALDMRMNQQQDFSAKDLIAKYSEKDLHRILGMYGEIKNARTLAQAIVTERIKKEIVSTQDLKNILQRYAPRGAEFKYFAQVFQALRIEVNEEMKALEEMLVQSAEILKVGGRLVVISYHSLEDRLVKNYIGKGKFHGEVEKDFYGNEIKPLEAVNRKPIEASEEEIKANPRARSGKLRIAEKL